MRISMMRTLRAEIIFQQRTQPSGTETCWAGAARAETSLQFKEAPARWRRGGRAPALPLFAEHPQAPRCLTPRHLRLGATQLWALSPAHRFLSGPSRPSGARNPTVGRSSCTANRQRGEASFIWASALLALELAGIFGSQGTVQH